MQELIEKAGVLMEALPYIQSFRDKVVVVKFGGSTMEDLQRKRSILKDIVFMECAGMRPVIVHGGGKAISAKLAEAGIETRFVNGLRYTCEDSIKVVDQVLHDEVNAELVQIMNEYNGKPFAVKGKNVLRTEPVIPSCPETGEKQSLGFVGQVVNVDTEQLRWILDRREVPIITPVGRDMNGDVYNVNADMAACRIAAELQAEKLVFLSDVPGLLKDHADEQSLISTLKLLDVESLIEQGVIAGGMVPKVRSAAEAMKAGTQKVHLIDGRVKHALLLEIFTRGGVGTEIVPE